MEERNEEVEERSGKGGREEEVETQTDDKKKYEWEYSGMKLSVLVKANRFQLQDAAASSNSAAYNNSGPVPSERFPALA
eukprot:748128-Hanusia_phi.AAC.4